MGATLAPLKARTRYEQTSALRRAQPHRVLRAGAIRCPPLTPTRRLRRVAVWGCHAGSLAASRRATEVNKIVKDTDIQDPGVLGHCVSALASGDRVFRMPQSARDAAHGVALLRRRSDPFLNHVLILTRDFQK